MAMKRDVTLQLTVTVPANVGESEVQQAINHALDEGDVRENDWGNWYVGGVTVVKVDRYSDETGDDYTNTHDWDEAQGMCLKCGATDCGEPCPEQGQ
jgi:hypothetical protein